jgi:hypothetical protein
MSSRSLVPCPRAEVQKRVLKKVPYVELFDGRLQGVVSSGSDIHRVYVSFIIAASGDFYCSTNNNRPCGGLRGSYCKHIDALVDNALAQLGAERVARFLGCAEHDISGARDIARQLGGNARKEQASTIFARFLDYLRYVELPPSTAPLPEMAWFLTG